jgi:hypothetical protein
MGSFGLTDIVGNTFGYSRVIVYGADGKIKFPTGGGGGTGTVTFIGMTVPSGFSVTPASITTSGTFAITGAGTVNDYIDGTGALQAFPTIPTYTVDNGLTENPANNFQLGGSLIQDTNIDGASNTWQLNFTDLYSSANTARFLYSFATNHAGNNTLLSLDSNSNVSRFSHEDGGTATISAIELTGTELRVQTPGYATATNGDVLTLIDNTTGEAEWQTPTSGSGGIPFGTAAGVDTYTTTIAGVAAYTDGDAYIIRFTSGNTTGCTLDINGIGAKDLYRNNDGLLLGGDIWDGAEMLVIYNSVLDAFDCIGTSPNALFAYVTNDDSVTITKGQAVYAFSGTGDRLTVKLAYNTSDSTSAQTVGLVASTSIAANQKGIIIIAGLLDGLSILPTATWTDGDPVYLDSTAGALTPTKPFAPNHLVYLGFVTTASNGSAGRLYVRVQNGFEMNELHDVQSNGAINNDILYRDTTVSPNLWKPASIPTILGYTPANAAADLTQISVSTANAREDNYAPTGWPGTTDRVKVIRINSTNTNYMMSLGGLANPSAGRIVTIYNNSAANNLIIIENLSTSSTAANRFRMTSGLPYFLLPTRSITFIYDGTYWTQLSSAPFGGLDFFEDFLQGPITATGANTTLTTSTTSGTGTGLTATAGVSANDDWGTTSLNTGSTAAGVTGITMNSRRNGGNATFGANSSTNTIPYLMVSKVGLSTLGTALQNYTCYVGLNGRSPLALSNMPNTDVGYYWRYPGSGSSFWNVVTQITGGVVVTTVTSVPVTANSNIWLGIYKVGGANTRDAIFFYSTDGITYQPAFKYVGTTGTIGGFPAIAIGSLAGGSNKEIFVDWLGTSFNLSR